MQNQKFVRCLVIPYFPDICAGADPGPFAKYSKHLRFWALRKRGSLSRLVFWINAEIVLTSMFCFTSGPLDALTRPSVKALQPQHATEVARPSAPLRSGHQIVPSAAGLAGLASLALRKARRAHKHHRVTRWFARPGSVKISIYDGKVKSYNKAKGFGFIECAETFRDFKRDVFLHKQQAESPYLKLQPGDLVLFEVEINQQGNPQARNVKKQLPGALDAKKRMEEEKANETDDVEEAWAAAEKNADFTGEDPVADAWALAEQEGLLAQEEQKEEQKKPDADKAAGEAGSEAEADFLGLNPALLRGAQEAQKKTKALEAELADAALLSDPKEYAKRTQTLSRYASIANILEELRQVAEEASDAKQMASQYAPGDEMHELALEEAQELLERQAEIANKLQLSMLTPDDRDDATSVLLEIRAGVGGDEASLWAEDLIFMYQKYCAAEDLRCQVISANKKEGFGYADATLKIEGSGAWTKLKFESGVHRVQRVPTTEKAGRVHTSTATVAIMPEIDDTGDIDEEKIIRETKFQYCRSGGKGGQNVNKVETAVHATHEPTGIHFFVTRERNQLQNRNIAIKLIISKIQSLEAEEAAKQEADMRSSQIGSGSRSEKTRSYNYKDNRVTDHRLNQNFPLSTTLEGNLQEPVKLLTQLDEQERLEALERSFRQPA